MIEAYILHHQGLGDFISCNGILRFLIKNKKYNKINLFVTKNHILNVRFMYRDESKIQLIEIKNIDEVNKIISNLNNNEHFIKIGFENFYKIIKKRENTEYTTEMIFYDQLNIPYKNRFIETFWKRDLDQEEKLIRELNPKNRSYIFVHDDPKRDLIISNDDILNYSENTLVLRNNHKYPIFYYGKILENAKEIHVMESSMRHIIESLNTNNVKLFLHSFRGKLSKGPFYSKKNKIIGSNKNWEIIVNNKNKNKFSVKKLFILLRKIAKKRLGI